MALDPFAETAVTNHAQNFVLEGVLALLMKLNPQEPIAQALHSHVMDRIEQTNISGVSPDDERDMRNVMRGVAIEIIGRASNAAK